MYRGTSLPRSLSDGRDRIRVRMKTAWKAVSTYGEESHVPFRSISLVVTCSFFDLFFSSSYSRCFSLSLFFSFLCFCSDLCIFFKPWLRMRSRYHLVRIQRGGAIPLALESVEHSAAGRESSIYVEYLR